MGMNHHKHYLFAYKLFLLCQQDHHVQQTHNHVVSLRVRVGIPGIRQDTDPVYLTQNIAQEQETTLGTASFDLGRRKGKREVHKTM